MLVHPAKRISVFSLVVLGAIIVVLVIREGMALNRRIVPSGAGALMAVDSDGLRRLNALYAKPTICGDPIETDGDAARRLVLCHQPVSIPSDVGKGIVLLPPGTKAKALERRYVFDDGVITADATFRRQADAIWAGAVEVEHIRLKDPPRKNFEEWVVAGYLQCDCSPLP